MRDCVATGSVATDSVATGFVAVGAVATGGVAFGTRVGGAGATGCLAGGFVTAGRDAGAGRAASCLARGFPAAESAGEGSVGAVVVVVGDRTAAPVEFPPPTNGVIPMSTRVDCLGSVGDPGLAGAAGVVTCTSCCPGVAEPLARGPLVGLNNPPLVVVVVVETLRIAREVRLESTAARVPSTRLRVPVSDAELAPTSTGEAEAPFDPVVAGVVAASAALA